MKLCSRRKTLFVASSPSRRCTLHTCLGCLPGNFGEKRTQGALCDVSSSTTSCGEDRGVEGCSFYFRKKQPQIYGLNASVILTRGRIIRGDRAAGGKTIKTCRVSPNEGWLLTFKLLKAAVLLHVYFLKLGFCGTVKNHEMLSSGPITDWETEPLGVWELGGITGQSLNILQQL